MAKTQCKICGGQLEFADYVPSAECPYCGTTTTFPKLNDIHKENFYNRAEHFRQNNEFDRALSQYKKTLELDASDPEVYWGMTLCRFGIEYVEDPASHERTPTCHRLQYDSILSDPNYLLALEYADYSQSVLYEAEAEKIARLQKSILVISRHEQPFDVFICYKEKTDGGSRTKDSAIAQDIYYQLTNLGLKVFFARITLEDKLGQEYEPYIFAALNSAKVMLVIGTKVEYFNAVWVKNEWSRYLELLKKDPSRLLIPCYKDMSVYDIPDALSMLQSQDMSKIGFIQDLLRGISKVLGAKPENEEKKTVSKDGAANSQVDAWLRRVNIFLGSREWENADKYCEKVLDVEPENATAYLLKTMAEFECHEGELHKHNIGGSKNFFLAKTFATGDERDRILRLVAQSEDHIKLYGLRDELRSASSLEQYRQLLSQCKALTSLPDEAAKLCAEIEAELEDKVSTYNQAGQHFKNEEFLKAKKLYERLDLFEDAKLICSVCSFRIHIRETRNFSSWVFVTQIKHWLVQFCESTTTKGMERKSDILYSFAEELENYHLGMALLFYQAIPREHQDVNHKIASLEQKISSLQQQVAEQNAAKRKKARKIFCIFALLAIIVIAIGFRYIANIKPSRHAQLLSEITKSEQAITFMLPGKVKMKMVLCPAGQFQMGSWEGETGRSSDETLHLVRLSKAFFIGQYEVTQQQYKAVMKRNPSRFKGRNLPVERVSWHDANDFCDKLNEFYGLSDKYRFALPTEAQWEYACRAGTKSAFHYGDFLEASMANFDGDYPYGGGRRGVVRNKTIDVGRFLANDWGIYDMHGNVWEWCADWYARYCGDETDPQGPSSDYGRVCRGGCWLNYAERCRSACRGSHNPLNSSYDLGFRIALITVQ